MAGKVTWLPQAGVYGAPALNGWRMHDMQMLTAFFELRLNGLLRVAADVVVVTASGERKLTEWSVTA